MAVLLSILLGAAPAAADDAGNLNLDLSVHVIGDGLVGPGDAGALTLDLAGLPIEIGARDGASPNNPGVRLGFDGVYSLPLGAGFAVVTTGRLNKTHYLDDLLLGHDHVQGKTSFRFEEGGFKTALEPGFDMDLLAGAVDARRLILDGRIAQGIANGVDLAATGGWTRHQQPLAGNGTDFGRARLGIDFKLGEKAALDLSYDLQQSWTELPQDATRRMGPSAALSLSLLSGLSLDIGYQYCESTRYAFSDGLRALVDDRHAASLGARWADPEMDYLTVTAGYRYDRVESAIAADDTQTHDGMISLAVSF